MSPRILRSMAEKPEEPPPATSASAQATLIENRLRHLDDIRGVHEIYPFEFPIKSTVSEIVETHDSKTAEELERQEIATATAGRILALRLQGKAGFLDLSDGRRRLQVYVRQDVVQAVGWALFKSLDLGDWIGVEGPLFRTRTGQLSLKARQLTFLAKSLRPLPEKWHGLRDV
jgi:lysyl-tRNA synthetase, class II